MKTKSLSHDKQRGFAAVEAALLLPVLVLIFLAVVEVGRLLDAWVIATNAAREGARYAAYGESASTVQNKVSAYLSSGTVGRGDVILPKSTDITVVGAQGTPGGPVQVIVPLWVHTYSTWVGNLGLVDPVLIQGVVTMRLQ
ncbi:MAG: pilus assembly protein [Chloroflexi bacterium]|nr:pilus assembly protein [Chloroflexota bacterium]